MVSLDDLQPFFLGFISVFWEAVVEEDFDGSLFAVIGIVAGVGNKTDKTT